MASSVYEYDIVAADIAAAASTTIDATSRPTQTGVEARITQLCADVNVELEGLPGGPTPSNITLANDANLYQKIRGYVIDEVVAWWHATNQDEQTSYAEAKAERWVAFKLELRDTPRRALGGSGGTSARSSVTASSPAAVDREWNKTWSFQ